MLLPLDTNAVIDLLAGVPGVLSRLADAEVFVSAVVLGELYFGAEKSAHVEANRTRIDAFAAGVSILRCDREVARRYGATKAALRARGKPIPENDIWIAATALAHSLTVLTRDTHFDHVSGLSLAAW